MQSKYHHFNKLDSTQDWAKENFSNLDLNQFHVITANEQTKGRGRLNKHWHSPPRQGAYVTYCFLVHEHAHPMNAISLVTGLTFAEVLQKMGLIVKLKWPNDIYINNKKAGGILVETKEIAGGKVFFVGVGLNINMEANELAQIDRPATSIFVETNKNWSIKSIMQPAETLFKRNLALFIEKGFEAFHKDFESLSLLFNKKILIDHGNKVVEGQYQEVDSQGSLILKLQDGTKKAFASGEIISWE